MEKIPVSPLEIGTNILTGLVGSDIINEKVRFHGEPLCVKLLTDPVYRNGRWEAMAQVNTALCLIEVQPFRKCNPGGI